MRLGRAGILAGAALLAGCAQDDPAPQPRASQEPAAALPAASATQPVTGPERRILAFGDSLFAGYRLAEDEGYPEQLEAALRAKGVNASVTDAGVSGDTTAAGRARISFVLDQRDTPPDLALVELGGNDLLRGIPTAETRENLDAILAELERRKIPILVMGMRAPPNLGAGFLTEFEGIYPALAEQYDAALVPFFMEPLLLRPELVQPDRVHPTARGVAAMVAATVDEVAAALPAN